MGRAEEHWKFPRIRGAMAGDQNSTPGRGCNLIYNYDPKSWASSTISNPRPKKYEKGLLITNLPQIWSSSISPVLASNCVGCGAPNVKKAAEKGKKNPFSPQKWLFSVLRTKRSWGGFGFRYRKMGNSSKDDSTTDGDTSSGDTPPSNPNLYAEGEKVLAYHGPRIYEAKANLLLPVPHLFVLFLLFLFCL